MICSTEIIGTTGKLIREVIFLVNLHNCDVL